MKPKLIIIVLVLVVHAQQNQLGQSVSTNQNIQNRRGSNNLPKGTTATTKAPPLASGIRNARGQTSNTNIPPYSTRPPSSTPRPPNLAPKGGSNIVGTSTAIAGGSTVGAGAPTALIREDSTRDGANVVQGGTNTAPQRSPTAEASTGNNLNDIQVGNENEIQIQKSKTNRKYCPFKDPRKCHIYINEILPSKQLSDGFSAEQFIEISRHCRRSASLQEKDNLNGYMVLIIDLTRTTVLGERTQTSLFLGKLIFSVDLRNQKLKQKPDESLNGETQYYFTIGTPAVSTADLKITALPVPVMHIKGNVAGFVDAIPHETNYPKMVLLLYIPVKQRSKSIYEDFFLNKLPANNHMTPKIITSSLLNKIKEKVVDLVVYGKQCSSLDADIIRQYYPKFPQDGSDYMISFEESGTRIPSSYSKCNDDNPYNPMTFLTAPNTPGYKNVCEEPIVGEPMDEDEDNSLDIPEVSYPFNMKGVRKMHGQCQKLILNCWSSVRHARLYPKFYDGYPQEVTAKILGITLSQVQLSSKKQRQNTLMMPGKKRKSPRCTLLKLDNFDQEKIRQCIKEGYAGGLALTSRQIHDKFLQIKSDEYDDELTRTGNTPANPKFKCNLDTFRRVLRFLGFRFRMIDKRAKIMQRADLVGWRGKYLRRLRRNRGAAKPKKLVYLDETWVDPHLRVAKGWIPAIPELKKDMALYTYGTMKVGKGARLIVLSAVAETGMIVDNVHVHKVSNSQSQLEDYHKNVDAEGFTRWFLKLLNNLDKMKKDTGDDYLIILDNASYHSSKLSPKKSDTKKTMYDWLKKYEHIEELGIQLPPFKTVRKWELQVLIDEVVINPIMEAELYTIDKMAKDRGYEILRLPPYHCHFSPIELIWKDTKYNTQKQNTHQNLDLVKAIIERELKEYSLDYVKRHFGHVRRLEDEAWELDGLFDNDDEIRPLVINVGSDSGSEADDEDTTNSADADQYNAEDDDLDEEYFNWVNDVLEVQLDEGQGGEMYESDGTLWVQEQCDPANEEHDVEEEYARYMNTDPNRRRRDPFLASRIMNSGQRGG